MKTIVNGLLRGRMTRWGMSPVVLAGALLAQAGDMVPYHSTVTGQAVVDPPSGAILSIEEAGIGTHIGKFTLSGAADADGVIWFTVTAANGDTLFGAVVGGSGNTVELAIMDGTGRFKGATGSITATLTIDPNPVSLDPLTLAYTATTTGTISTVGSNKKK
jgi:hypothetical protein